VLTRNPLEKIEERPYRGGHLFPPPLYARLNIVSLTTKIFVLLLTLNTDGSETHKSSEYSMGSDVTMLRKAIRTIPIDPSRGL